MKYYDLQANWTNKIVPHLDNQELNKILIKDFHKFSMGRWRKPFKDGMYPEDIETCDWRMHRRQPWPKYWKYVKFAACHWIANFALKLAMLVEPNKSWRIISGENHSTVWDGEETLFDFNWRACGVPPDRCFQAAMMGTEYLPGEFITTPKPLHHTKEKNILEEEAMYAMMGGNR